MLLQKQLLVLLRIEFEDIFPPRSNPLGGRANEGKDKLFEPVGGF